MGAVGSMNGAAPGTAVRPGAIPGPPVARATRWSVRIAKSGEGSGAGICASMLTICSTAEMRSSATAAVVATYPPLPLPFRLEVIRSKSISTAARSASLSFRVIPAPCVKRFADTDSPPRRRSYSIVTPGQSASADLFVLGRLSRRATSERLSNYQKCTTVAAHASPYDANFPWFARQRSAKCATAACKRDFTGPSGISRMSPICL